MENLLCSACVTTDLVTCIRMIYRRAISWAWNANLLIESVIIKSKVCFGNQIGIWIEKIDIDDPYVGIFLERPKIIQN